MGRWKNIVQLTPQQAQLLSTEHGAPSEVVKEKPALPSASPSSIKEDTLGWVALGGRRGRKKIEGMKKNIWIVSSQMADINNKTAEGKKLKNNLNRKLFS